MNTSLEKSADLPVTKYITKTAEMSEQIIKID
jgi:hypothetical protein